IETVLYLGDILVPYGDFFNRNHSLEKAGYVEQYWYEELKKFGGQSVLNPGFDEAVKLSREFKISLHPSYIYYWNEISFEQFNDLVDWISHGVIREEILSLPYGRSDKERFARGKKALELIGCEHAVATENVLLSINDTKSLLFNLGVVGELESGMEKLARKITENREAKSVLELLDKVCDINTCEKSLAFKLESAVDFSQFSPNQDKPRLLSRGTNPKGLVMIRDKSGTFIGARMGRPEKAKLRKLTGSPHCLFPVGEEGGRLRSVIVAVERGYVKAEFPLYFCDECKKETIYPKCEICESQCKKLSYKGESYGNKEENDREFDYKEKSIDMKHYFDSAKKRIGLRTEDLPPVIKGVRGTSNKDHSCENLAKGLLRAKHGLHVNKDGTIRYDMTEMPITHFRPLEIGTSIEKLRELGYKFDIYGKPLEREDQLLEIFPHDIILPSSPESPDERADDVFLSVTYFIDDEFEKLYKLPKFFNAKKREDLIGVLLGCMSPHTSATTVGRLIGFSKIQAMLASPYIHAAMRRDCDGDEAAVMLLMDLLLNFSRKFIPSHRGGTQDAPLVLNMRIRANEVDDMIFDLDVSDHIPLELYEAANEKKHPTDIKMEQVKNRLGTDREFNDLWFSYDTSNINLGPLCSSYKTLPTMQDKVDKMMILCKKIRAVDVSDVARLVIERHFIRDIRGNLRKFSMQVFRCVGCNEKYRRPPLNGKCGKCGGRLIFTISEGSILKYMNLALDLARTYNTSPYLIESLELTEMYIQSIFGKEREKQEALGKWF
ncbi:MAG: DNA polymerase II large subunit, partial [Nanoarchaeota archaeon]|nr:DNA polymerase II large subunit [Nanoarchaeota archaeon]